VQSEATQSQLLIFEWRKANSKKSRDTKAGHETMLNIDKRRGGESWRVERTGSGNDADEDFDCSKKNMTHSTKKKGGGQQRDASRMMENKPSINNIVEG